MPCAKKVPGATRAERGYEVSSLKMIVGVLETLYSTDSRGINGFIYERDMENR